MKYHENWLLLGAMLVCIVSIYSYPLALPTPLLDPDEGLHASISQEMVEHSDYVVPRIQGEPFLDKPILYFAAQAFSLQILGMNEAAVRLPGMLFALFGVATTALLAGRMFDRSTGFVTALVSLTLVVPFSLAQAAAHDVALVPWTNLLLLCWWEADRNDSIRKRLLISLAASLFVALALLTKGLIGVAVDSVGYVTFVLLSRHVSLPLIARFTLCLLLGSALASPWFLVMEQSAPGYLWYYFIERHFSGFVSATQQHGGAPWHYYLPILFGGTMPWVLYLGPGMWQTWIDRHHGQNQREAKAVLFAVCWFVAGLLFLSVASSKLITYALPLFPAIAILVGHSLKRFLQHELAEHVDVTFAKVFQLVCAVGCVAPFAALLVTDHATGSSSPALAYLLALLSSATGIAAIFLARRNQRYAAVTVGSLWFSLFFIAMMTWSLQKVAAQYSQKPLGVMLADQAALPRKIVLVGSRVASVVFYLTPEQRQRLEPGQIVTATPSDLDHWSTIPQDTLLAITEQAFSESQNLVVKQFAEANDAEGNYRLARRPTAIAGKRGKQIW